MKLYVFLVLVGSLVFAQGQDLSSLHLSADQKVKMQGYEAEIKACEDKSKLKILSILTDEQKIKYLQMQQAKSGKKNKQINMRVIKKVD